MRFGRIVRRGLRSTLRTQHRASGIRGSRRRHKINNLRNAIRRTGRLLRRARPATKVLTRTQTGQLKLAAKALGVTKVLKGRKPATVRRGGSLIARYRVKSVRVGKRRLHGTRIHNRTFRSRILFSQIRQGRPLAGTRYRIRTPNEMGDIKAAIKGGFKP